VHAADPVNTLYFPASHAEQVVAPTAVEYVPASQSEQVAFPVNVLYLPISHAAHGPPFGPVDPALQVQLVKAELPAGELERDGQEPQYSDPIAPTAVPRYPALQSVHAADPVVTLCFPATHAVHGPPSGPVYPWLQMQRVTFAVPYRAE
jgi:hypothetical protein